MKQLQIDEKTALSLYGSASSEFKSMLEDSFGKSFFSDVKTRIKTYEDACIVLGEKTVDEETFSNFGLNKNDIAYMKLTQIVRALNEGWVAKVYDNENRWYPIFRHNGSPSGFAFHDSYYANGSSNAGSGSRLCLRDKSLSDYCGSQFVDIWREFLV